MESELQKLINDAAEKRYSKDVNDQSTRRKMFLDLPVGKMRDSIAKVSDQHSLSSVIDNGWGDIYQVLREHYKPGYIKRETELFYKKVTGDNGQ